jgi:hypothetical protein
MKSIAIFGLYLLLCLSSFSQQKEHERNKKDDDKGSSYRADDEKIKNHEQIIWAGTGINLNEKSKDVKNVPDAIMNSFRQFFPNQQIDDVRKYHGLYAITFSNEVYTTTFIYKADGTFVEARTVATDSIIPQLVKEKIKGSMPDYSTSEVVMIEKANKEKFYRVHLKKNKENKFAVYNEHGQEVQYDY